MDMIDIIYIVAMVLIIGGGIACLAIFLPKENKLRNERENCYRYALIGDTPKRISGKANLGERESKYFYIDKGPLEVDCYCDKVESSNGKTYNSVVLVSVYLPESSADEAAQAFMGMNTEGITAFISEALSITLKELISEYDGNMSEADFTEKFRESAEKKLADMGYSIYQVHGLKIKAE